MQNIKQNLLKAGLPIHQELFLSKNMKRMQKTKNPFVQERNKIDLKKMQHK